MRTSFKHGMTLFSKPLRPPHAVLGTPIETPEVRARQTETVRLLRDAVRINARMGKGDGK